MPKRQHDIVHKKQTINTQCRRGPKKTSLFFKLSQFTKSTIVVVVLYVHPIPIHKKIYKIGFDCLVWLLNMIKRPHVPFLPKSSKQAQGSGPPSFLVSSLLIDNNYNFQKKISTSSSSQSLNCLEKWGLQPPPSLTYSHAYATHPSLLEAKENKFTKPSSKVKSSHHKSF